MTFRTAFLILRNTSKPVKLISCCVSDFAGVTREEQAATLCQCRELIDRYHYLGYRSAYGASLRYLIETLHGQNVVPGCPGFSSSAWQIKAWDRWIGWNEAHC